MDNFAPPGIYCFEWPAKNSGLKNELFYNTICESIGSKTSLGKVR